MDGPTACLSFTFAVEKITGVSVDDENNTKYEVQWAPVWVSSCNLRGCEKLIKEFLQQQNVSDTTFDLIKEEPSDAQVQEKESNLFADLDLVNNESLKISSSFD